MKTKNAHRVIYAAAGVTLLSLAANAHAQSIAIDGSLDAAYGNPLAVQTNNTQFGDNATDTSGNSNGGSELDAAYGNISGGNLYLFIAGNLEANYNHLNIFIADGRTSGQSTLQTNGTLGAMNGSKFSPGFLATYAIDVNGGGGSSTSTPTVPPTEYVNTNDLTNTTGTNYIGNFNAGTGSPSVLNGLTFSFNNGNIAGVTGGQSSADSVAASNVFTGLEIAIPLSVLGSPHGNIEVLADVNGGSDGYLSNQFLPGLPTIEPNLGTGTSAYSGTTTGLFNFSSTPGEYFTVTAPVASGINSTWLASGNGSWSTSANWSAGIPNSPGDIANFNGANTAASIVTLDGNHTVGQIQFNSLNTYNISQGTTGILTINDTGDASGVNPLITVNSGSHIISAPVNLSNGVTVTTLTYASINLSGVVAGSGAITKTGAGNLTLSGANTFTGNITVLNGSLELDNNQAASSSTVAMGDETADGVFTSLNLGVAGVTIATPITTNYDDAGGDNQRAIAALYTSGSATLTGGITVNGGIVLSAPTGASLVVSGTIQDGTEVNPTKPSYDLTVNGQIGTSGGTVTLTVPETYTGQTIVNGGTLNLMPAATLATSTIIANTGGVVNFAAQNSGGIFVRNYAGTLNINGGVATVAASTLTANRQLLVTTGLTFAGTAGAYTGQLDLANNDLDVANGSLSQITGEIQQGFNAGGTLWTGQGIVSSSAAANPKQLTALGVIANTTNGATPLYGSGTTLGLFDGTNPAATDVLVKYTYYGDANLDGKVDASDYSLIDSGFVTKSTGWYNGDFNYDGVINGSDYTLIDNAFNTQGARLAASIASPSAVSTAEIAGSSAVPEPTSLGLITIAVAGLLGRRKRPD